ALTTTASCWARQTETNAAASQPAAARIARCIETSLASSPTPRWLRRLPGRSPDSRGFPTPPSRAPFAWPCAVVLLGADLSLTVAGAAQDFHLFPEHLVARANSSRAARRRTRHMMDHMQKTALLLDAP